jgi:flagellar hook-length control protein FliK
VSGLPQPVATTPASPADVLPVPATGSALEPATPFAPLLAALEAAEPQAAPKASPTAVRAPVADASPELPENAAPAPTLPLPTLPQAANAPVPAAPAPHDDAPKHEKPAPEEPEVPAAPVAATTVVLAALGAPPVQPDPPAEPAAVPPQEPRTLPALASPAAHPAVDAAAPAVQRSLSGQSGPPPLPTAAPAAAASAPPPPADPPVRPQPHRGAPPVPAARAVEVAAPQAAFQRAPAQPDAPAPAAPPQTPAPPVRLVQLPEVVRSVIHVAAAGNAASARIVLSPPELGHVQIRLHYADGGVTATVTAEHPDAVQALTQSAGELRRALEDQGLTVNGLDVARTGLQEHADPKRHDPRTGAQQQPAHRQEPEDELEEITIEVSRLPLASGQVDVLA